MKTVCARVVGTNTCSALNLPQFQGSRSSFHSAASSPICDFRSTDNVSQVLQQEVVAPRLGASKGELAADEVRSSQAEGRKDSSIVLGHRPCPPREGCGVCRRWVTQVGLPGRRQSLLYLFFLLMWSLVSHPFVRDPQNLFSFRFPCFRSLKLFPGLWKEILSFFRHIPAGFPSFLLHCP